MRAHGGTLLAALASVAVLVAGCSVEDTPSSSATTATTSPPGTETTVTAPASTSTSSPTTTTLSEPAIEAGLVSLSPPWHAMAVADAQVVVVGTVTRGSSVSVGVTSDTDGSLVSEFETTVTNDYFEQQVELAPGGNTVTINARLADQVATVTLDARHEPEATVELAFLRQASETEIVADFAQWLTGDEAAQAAYEDGEIASVAERVPNDYYIRNVNPQLRTLPVADDVVVWLATSAAGPVTSVEIEMTDWLALYNDGVAWGEDQEAPPPEPPHFGYFGAGSETTPYWLVIIDGEVIAIEQQYRP